MNNSAKLIFCTIILFIYSSKINANNIWILDKELSEITFEVPVFLSQNVKGQFTKFEGSIVINEKNIKKNRAIFSVNINSLEFNYKKYKKLLLSNIFFDEEKFPIAIIDTKKFTIPLNSKFLQINSDLQIKNILHNVPTDSKINYLANNIIHIQTELKFSRTDFQLGKGSWSSTLILRDQVIVNANLFLIQE